MKELKLQVKMETNRNISSTACSRFNKLANSRKSKDEIKTTIQNSHHHFLNELGKNMLSNGNQVYDQIGTYFFVEMQGCKTHNGEQIVGWRVRNTKDVFGELFFGTTQDFDKFVLQKNSKSVGVLLFETFQEQQSFLNKLRSSVARTEFGQNDNLEDQIAQISVSWASSKQSTLKNNTICDISIGWFSPDGRPVLIRGIASRTDDMWHVIKPKVVYGKRATRRQS